MGSRPPVPRRYTSAGAVIVTGPPQGRRVLLLDQVRRDGERQTVAPKGGIEAGETDLAAAVREAGEEAGVTGLRHVADLGEETYQLTDGSGTAAVKTVHWYLFTTHDAVATPAAAEGFVAARWVDLPAARIQVSHDAFRTVLDRASAILDGLGDPQTG